ncbi:hypothetical protein CHS0354_026751 [Potamilus streckersoni]|uniref:Uncharacterized protein n=1 Tax=Potamilus streckersoni TaxID=2493646 RepID=A0AAE0RN04_9BIVA|nr:hypothetical protein CHS0354_026751 [Potamilus streckersoni]
MAEESEGGRISKEDIREARRLQELFHGRFSQEEAVRLYTFCNRNLQEAINFVFHGEPEDIRNVIGEGEWKIVAARNNRDINQVLKNEIPDQVRQFGCESCDKVWWRRVPIRKMVSRCKSCKKKFDAIPREDEWGLAKYICSKCSNEFTGYGAMGRTMSPCYSCNNLCTPAEILPPFTNRPRRKSWNVHSCIAHNCYNRTPSADSDAMMNLCVHPKSMIKSLGRKVLNPSHLHVTTGSTVKTFLNQDDLESLYEPTLDDISEELDDLSDDNAGNQ